MPVLKGAAAFAFGEGRDCVEGAMGGRGSEGSGVWHVRKGE